MSLIEEKGNREDPVAFGGLWAHFGDTHDWGCTKPRTHSDLFLDTIDRSGATLIRCRACDGEGCRRLKVNVQMGADAGGGAVGIVIRLLAAPAV